MVESVSHGTEGAAQAVRPQGPSSLLQRNLRDEETLLWHGTPQRRAWYVSTFVATPIGLLVFVGLVGGAFAGFAVADGAITILGAVKILGGIWLGLAGLAILAQIQMLRHLEYTVTDQRLIKLGGVVGRDVSTVRLEDIRDVEANAGIWKKLFGVGGIRIKVPGGSQGGAAMAGAQDRGSAANAGIDMVGLEGHRDVRDTIEEARKEAKAIHGTGGD